MAVDTEARLIVVEEELKKIKDMLMQTTIGSGTENTYHEQIDMDGFPGTLQQMFQHGSQGLPAPGVDRTCLRVGADGAHAINETGDFAPIGMSRGLGGEFISHYDSLPPGEPVVIP